MRAVTVCDAVRGDYCVSKAGLAVTSKLCAVRLAPEGIPVYEVRPGIITSDMTAAVHELYDARLSDGLVPERRSGPSRRRRTRRRCAAAGRRALHHRLGYPRRRWPHAPTAVTRAYPFDADVMV